jgi:hypothetical protein
MVYERHTTEGHPYNLEFSVNNNFKMEAVILTQFNEILLKLTVVY